MKGMLMGMRFILGDKNVLISIVVTAAHLYAKNHWTEHFKCMNCIVCKIYFSKAITKKKPAQNLMTGRKGHIWRDFALDIRSTTTTDHLYCREYWGKKLSLQWFGSF